MRKLVLPSTVNDTNRRGFRIYAHIGAIAVGLTCLGSADAFAVDLPGLITINGSGVDAGDYTVPASGSTINVNDTIFFVYTGSLSGTGDLKKSGSGTLVLTGSNSFQGGLTLDQGTVVLGNDTAAGQWESSGASNYAQRKGLILVRGDGTIAVTENRVITNHIQVGQRDSSGNMQDPTAGLTFDITAGTTLEITGVELTTPPTGWNYDGVGTGGAINVSSLGGGDGPVRFGDPNNPQGHLVFSNNLSSRNGGAVGAYFEGTTPQPAVLDFRGLESVTFRDNIGGTVGIYAGGSGGAIFSRSQSSDSIVRLGDHATFDGNIAANIGIGTGGAIYASSLNGSSTVAVELGKYAVFTGNIAGNKQDLDYRTSGGGAIYVSGGQESRVSLGDYASFSDNIAGYTSGGTGGAIHATGAIGSGIGTVTLGKHTLFSGNRAGGGGGDGSGGAIWASHEVSISAHTLFESNYASRRMDAAPNSRGGAIYLNGRNPGSGSFNTALLDTGTGADAGAIAFRGNYDNVAYATVGQPDTTNANANSIHLAGRTQLALRGDGNIYFDDPISATTTDTGYGDNSLEKTGSGFVQFVGDSVLNPRNYAGGAVDVLGGTFRLADKDNGAESSFTTQGNGATFTLGTDAVLAGHGTITAQQGFMVNGTISPDSDRFEIPEFVRAGDADATDDHYNFFKEGRTDLADDRKKGTLKLIGDVTLDGATLVMDVGTGGNDDLVAVTGAVTFGSNANTIALTGGLGGNTYDILTSTTDMTLSNTDFSAPEGLYADGYSLVRGTHAVQLKQDDAKILQVALGEAGNISLTWTGDSSSVWGTSANDANWTDNPNGAAAETRFMDGDTVIFTEPTAPASITIDGDIAVSGMQVTGGEYTFTGGAIGTVDPVGDELPSPTKALDVLGDAKVTFTNDLSFENGYRIGQNASMTFSGNALTGDIMNNGGFTFDVEGNRRVVYDDTMSGIGGFQKTGDGELYLGGVHSGATGRFDVSEGRLAGAFTYGGHVAVDNGATLAPGGDGSLGSMTVGSASFADGSTFHVRVTQTSSDKLVSTGDVVINSGANLLVTRLTPGATWKTDWDYTIIQSTQGRITHDFAGNINTDDLPFLDVVSFVRNGNTLILSTAYNGTNGPAPIKHATPNQIATHEAVASLPAGHGAQDYVANMPGDSGLWALDQLSGEAYATHRSALRAGDATLVRQFRASLSQRFHAWKRDGTRNTVQVASREDTIELAPSAGGGVATRDGLWTQVSGSYESFDGNYNAADATMHGIGITVGVDVDLGNGWFTGGAIRYANRDFKVGNRASDADINSISAALFGGKAWDMGPGVMRATLGGAYTYHDTDFERSAAQQTLKADYGTHTGQIWGEAAYALAITDWFFAEPFASLTWNTTHTDSVREGGGWAALKVDSDSVNTATTNLGVRFDMRMDDLLTFNLDLGWEHTIGRLDTVARMAFLDGGNAFSIRGVSSDRDLGVVSAGVTAALSPEWSVQVVYDGAFGENTASHGGRGRVVYSW